MFKARRIAGVLFLFTVLGAGSVAMAADHTDAPGATADPAADIADFYAFMNPNDSGELILIMTVVPFAGPDATFSDAVTYTFHIENANGTLTTTADCEYDVEDDELDCEVEDESVTAGFNGQGVSTSGDVRLFAGLRDDPFFFDLLGFRATVEAGAPMFTGDNFLEGHNVVAIVLGIGGDALGALTPDDGDGDTPDTILRLYAATTREM